MAGNYSNTGSSVPGVHSVGLRSVGAYQVSGHPFLTGSALTGNVAGLGGGEGEDKIQFPFVTKSIMITRTGGTTGNGVNDHIRFSFASKHASNVNTNRHWLSIQNTGDSLTIDIKCKEIYIWVGGDYGSYNASYELYAELTNIPTSSMFTLPASGITE